ncbi:MAG: hypothetical protein JSW23_04600 [Planctomycetota bacterium]|nr:MAG: hypothetical protein JSW23_04600 [Planctomycetota bacterium]
MLPFMREQNDDSPKPLKEQGFLEKSPAQKSSAHGTAVADQTSDSKQQSGHGAGGAVEQNTSQNLGASDGGIQVAAEPSGGDREAQYLTVAGRGKVVRKLTYLLVALFISGLVCLFIMIKKTTPNVAAASGGNDTQIELAISRLTGVSSEMFSRMDEIVRKFYEFSDVQQVKVNELVKNPFKHEIYFGDLRTGPNRLQSGFGRDAEAIRQLTGSMQLLSIIESDLGNCCMIDDSVLYEGDSIRGFKVREIGDKSVKLQSEESEIVLKLSE